MKIGVISDIHGNINALEAVLEDLKNKKVEKIICLGDIIARGCKIGRGNAKNDENGR